MRFIVLFLLATCMVVPAVGQQTTLNEGFEDWPPVNWQFYLLGDATDGWRDDFEGIAHTGNQSAYSSISNEFSDNWMVTPGVLINSADYQLTFWEYHDASEFYEKVSVWVSAGSSDPLSGDFVQVYEVSLPITEEVWEERVVDLSTYNGQTIYVGWRYEGMFHEYYLDDVVIAPDSFTDVVALSIENPTGVSETPGVEDVIVQIENAGDTTIDEVSVNWSVNGSSQSTFNGSDLGLASGNAVSLNIGSFNFGSIGNYDIDVTVTTPGDFDPSNNTANTTYTIATQKDASLAQVSPEGMIPSSGTYPVRVLLENLGDNVIDDYTIDWEVNSVAQTPISGSGIGLEPGASVWIELNDFAFSTGISMVTATVDVLGDIDSANDSRSAQVAVETFTESFEGAQFPPNNWEVVFGSRETGFETPVDGDFYYSSQPDSNVFGTVFDTIYSPRLLIANGDTYTINIKPSAFLAASHSVVARDQQTGEVTLVENLNPSPDVWQEIVIDLSSVTGVYQIGITSSVVDFPGLTVFDQFSSTAELHLYDRDLSIEQGDLYFLAGDGQSSGYSSLIKNEGSLPVSGADYTVRLMEGNNVLASAAGVDLASWEEAEITIEHTLAGLGQRRLHIEIEYNQDQYPANNSFRETTVTVVPAEYVLNEIGSKDYIDLNFPFTSNGNSNSLGEDDLSQIIYKTGDFPNNGMVYGIIYSYDNLLEADYVQDLPLRLGIAQTQENDLSNGWLPQEDFTLLFDGVVEILPGFDRELFIPFSEPVPVTGLSNLVVQNFQFDPEWPPSILRFYATSNGGEESRSISALDVFDLDPETIDFWTAFPNFPYTRFVMTVEDNSSVLSGTVSDQDGFPLENAQVSVPGTGVEVQTDATGNYTLPPLPYGTYSLRASLFGYLDDEQQVTLGSPSATLDLVLQERPQLSLAGRVVGSNDESIPLEGVEISLSGYQDGLTSTDSDGLFSFDPVFGFADYTLQFDFYGYESLNIPVSINEEAIDLGDIVLQQEFLPAFGVVAADDGEVTVNWGDPLQSQMVQLQNDLNVISNSYTNEPNEEVWLGNFFTIDQPTTITSIEIQTEVFPLTADFVSIDIFDRGSEEILASSQPFLITEASVITVEVPNIVVDSDVVVAVHWQNNSESTNALAIDFSSSDVPNTAVIKYPGEPIQLLTDFFGGGPDSAFHVRLNTMETGSPVTNGEELTYNVLRGLASEFPDTSNWEVINSNPVNGTSYVDMEWLDQTVEGETYRFAVEVIYSEGNSELTFSNELIREILGLDDVQSESPWILYPNPADELVNLEFSRSVEITGVELIDMLGRVVFVQEATDLNDQLVQMDIGSLSSGTYIVRVVADGKVLQKKLLVR